MVEIYLRMFKPCQNLDVYKTVQTMYTDKKNLLEKNFV